MVDVGVALLADAEAAEVVQLSEAALDDPALAAEAGAVVLPRRAITGLMPRARAAGGTCRGHSRGRRAADRAAGEGGRPCR